MAKHDSDPSAEIIADLLKAASGKSPDELRQLIAHVISATNAANNAPAPRRSQRQPRRNDVAMLTIRVDLNAAKPPIWRRLDVRSDITLDVLHQVLQAAFSWTDSHLHRFALGADVFDRDAELFLCPFDVADGDEIGTPAKDVRIDETLAKSGDVLRYCYDYGDSWDLTIKLESVAPASTSSPAASCIDGRRAAPPEDCGGLRDADSLADVLDDPAHFDVEDVNLALADPYVALLDVSVNPRLVDVLYQLRGTELGDELVSRVVSLTLDSTPPTSPDEITTALHPFMWFLDRVGGDGIPLTSAGHLRPEDVVAAAEVIPRAAGWFGKNNREAQTMPVLQFRESLQGLGLVRKYRGRLALTKAGAAARGRPDQLWRHLAQRLPFGGEKGFEAASGLISFLFLASSPDQDVPFDRVAEALTSIGWRHSNRDPVSSDDARDGTHDSLDVLRNITTGPRVTRWHDTISGVGRAMARAALVSGQNRE